ncbi:MAG: serine/threonine protein kinase [Deltaproteobacteria bacterium]|nr:serine/threonine protein kinase [Deltaproteobacteria bacterium]
MQRGCEHRGYHGIPDTYLSQRLDPRIGLLLGDKYLLVQTLGKGGMGVVMVALQQPLLREVALKLISGLQVDETVRKRFVREARAVAALDHPNIVKLIDFGVARIDEDAPYMVMELLHDAVPLRQVFASWREERPTWRAVGEVFGQLLSALASAHGKGIVHRDIKPDNAMASQAHGYEWFVKVLDFGLAKSFEAGHGGEPDMLSLTGTGQLVGTPLYMAPEQLAGEGMGQVDHRADIYSVGVMLFEVVTGRRPYAEAETMQLVFAKANPERDPLRRAADLDHAGPIAQVVRKAMAWKSADRYRSAEDMRSALLAVVAQQRPDDRLADLVDDEASNLETQLLRATHRYSPQNTPVTGSLPLRSEALDPALLQSYASSAAEAEPAAGKSAIGTSAATFDPADASPPPATRQQRTSVPLVAALVATLAAGAAAWSVYGARSGDTPATGMAAVAPAPPPALTVPTAPDPTLESDRQPAAAQAVAAAAVPTSPLPAQPTASNSPAADRGPEPPLAPEKVKPDAELGAAKAAREPAATPKGPRAPTRRSNPAPQFDKF